MFPAAQSNKNLSNKHDNRQPGSIRLRDVDFAFDAHGLVLRNIAFEAEAGSFHAVLGPSGCGKSTLLRLIAGLLEPTSGEVSLGGETPQPRTAFVFQEPRLLPWRTVRDNIRLPLELEGVGKQEQNDAVAESLELIGLSLSDAAKYPRMLSGGMKMRVSLARALVTHPDILLLDEPFAALDDILRQQLNEELLRLRRQCGWTAVFVTHNVAEAVFLSQSVSVMRASPGEITHKIETPFGAERTPELRDSADFARHVGHVSQLLRQGSA